MAKYIIAENDGRTLGATCSAAGLQYMRYLNTEDIYEAYFFAAANDLIIDANASEGLRFQRKNRNADKE